MVFFVETANTIVLPKIEYLYPRHWVGHFAKAQSNPVQSELLSAHVMGCRGPAPVDPGWFEGGDGVGILGNNLFNYRERGIRKLAEKKLAEAE